MLVYDYSVTGGYDLFMAVWGKATPQIKLLEQLPALVRRIKITKEGLVIIKFMPYCDMPKDVLGDLSKEDLLKFLIQYPPAGIMEINRNGDPEAYIDWVPSEKEGSHISALNPDGSDKISIVILCKSITKHFLDKNR